MGGKKSEHPHNPSYLPTIFPEKYYGKPKINEPAQLKAQDRYDVIAVAILHKMKLSFS